MRQFGVKILKYRVLICSIGASLTVTVIIQGGDCRVKHGNDKLNRSDRGGWGCRNDKVVRDNDRKELERGNGRGNVGK